MKKNRVRTVLCTGLCLLLAATALAACRGPAGEEAAVLKVCEVTHSIFYAPQYAAAELGYFADEGITLDLTVGEGADAVMAAVLAGQIDVGFAGPEAAIYVAKEGKADCPRVFAQVTRRDGSFLLARQPDAAFDWQSLRGKVLLPGRKGGVPYMTLRHVLRAHGLDPDLDLVMDSSVQYALMGPSFAAGTGDYVTMFEPSASAMQAQGSGYIVASVGAEAGDVPYTAYFALQSRLEKDADLYARFTRALARGQRWVADHTAAEIAAVIAPAFPDADPAALQAGLESYRAIGAWCEDPVMDPAAFDRLQQIMREAGELDVPVPFNAVVDNTFAEQAARAVG